jgi:hypothetical protein
MIENTALPVMNARIALLVVLIASGQAAIASDSFPAITTTDGKTYDHITAQRADPDGLYIEYAPGGKGLGSAKLKFGRLSNDLQKQYGYDADAARKYEDETYKANVAFQTWVDQQEAARQKARADADARALQEEVLLAQQIPVPVAPAPADYGNYDGGWYYGGRLPFRTVRRFNHFTGSTFRGTVPFAQLITPLGFSPTKMQVSPATPPPRQNFSRSSERQR